MYDVERCKRMTDASTPRRRRRGLSLIEIMSSTAIGLIVVIVTTAFGSVGGKLFLGCVGGANVQRQAMSALQTMAADIRAARGIATGTDLGANPPTLVLQMPAFNADRSLDVPVRNGNTVTYSLSDDRRSLVRSESSVGSRTVAVVDQYGSLGLSYGYTTSDVNGNGTIESNEYVTLIASLNITDRLHSGTSVYDRSFASSQEILLRNR